MVMNGKDLEGSVRGLFVGIRLI